MVLNARGGVCTGVVLAPEIVLTAAHCLVGSAEIRIHYRDGSDPVLIAPAARAVHPGYDAGAVKGRRRSIDLALLRVPNALPARFTPATLSSTSPDKGQAVIVAGYGLSREGDPRSTGTYRTARIQAVEPYGRSSILLWAAAPSAAPAGACEGDSGGPISDEAGAVMAVTTWARGGGTAQCGSMTQGILVGPQRAWIERTLQTWSSAGAWR